MTFASPVDGSQPVPVARGSMQIQALLDSDIVDAVRRMHAVRDRPTARTGSRTMRWLSLRWAAALDATSSQRRGNPNALFGIVQGGMYRATCATNRCRALVEIGLPGYAIGGLSVGEPKEEMLRRAEARRPAAAAGQAALPDGRRHAGGPGRGRARGVDMFDCVMPTRKAPRPRLHLGWTRQPAQRQARRGLDSARSAKLVPRRPRLLASLSAPPRALGRIAGLDAAVVEQHVLLPGADGSHALGNRGGKFKSWAAEAKARIGVKG